MKHPINESVNQVTQNASIGVIRCNIKDLSIVKFNYLSLYFLYCLSSLAVSLYVGLSLSKDMALLLVTKVLA